MHQIHEFLSGLHPNIDRVDMVEVVNQQRVPPGLSLDSPGHQDQVSCVDTTSGHGSNHVVTVVTSYPTQAPVV